jgi:tRNA (guanine37-N1)-methyltransferase
MSNSPHFDVITIFPDYMAPLHLSLMGKAEEKGLVSFGINDLRKHSTGVHNSVDDTPYGGGAGMVMMPEPWGAAIDEVAAHQSGKVHDLVVLTPAGKKFTQSVAQEMSGYEHLIFACGRYEGIDIRVTDHYRNQPGFRVHEVSIGDYVLGGGEVATLVMMEAIIRLIPGVLGNPHSIVEESHSLTSSDGEVLVEYPNYTKPVEWRGLQVPDVLLSGNHGEIAKWREEQARVRTHKLKNEGE